MEAVSKILDSAVNEVATGAVGAVSDSISSIPNELYNAVDATSTDAGTAIHQGYHNAVSVTINPTETTRLENQTDSTTDDFYSCAYTPGPEGENIEKLIPIGSTDWVTNKLQGTIILRLELPLAFWDEPNKPAYGQSHYFRFVRTGYHFKCMISAPVGYAGALIMFYAPGDLANRIGRKDEAFSKYGLNFNTVMNLPHTILNVSDNTECTLVVPYMSRNNYGEVVFQSKNRPPGGCVYLAVLSQLYNPTSASNTLNATIYGAMEDLDFQCPRPFYNEGRKTLRRKKVFIPPEPPKQERTIIQPGPGAWNAANSNICAASESMAIAGEATAIDFATAGVNCAETDLVDILKRWSIARTVQWDGSSAHGTGILDLPLNFNFGNFERIEDCFEYFRGSLEFKILTIAPKSSQGRIQVSWFPHENRTFTYTEAKNAVYVVADVGGPPPVLVCPFTSSTWRHPLSDYGRIRAHVVNAFRSNPAAANTATLILLVRAGPDFKLYSPKRPSENSDIQTVGQGVSESLQNDSEPNVFLNFERVNLDLTSQSHSSIRNILGRPWYEQDIEPNASATRRALTFPTNSLASLAYSYLYWTGEFSITVYAARDPVIFCHSYEDHGSDLPLEDLMSMGAVFVPRFTIKTVRIPYYAKEPLRVTYAQDSLGYLYVNSPQRAYLFISMTGASFFVKTPQPLPKKRSMTLLPLNEISILRTKAKPWLKAPGISEWIDCGEADAIEDYRDKHQDVTLGGDVELNPGPQLVYKDRGFYKHYGVRVGQHVFHTSTENIFKTMLDGKVGIQQSDFTPDWHIAGPETVSMAEKYLKAGMLPEFTYSIDNNCESWARSMINGDGLSYQGSAIKLTLALAVALCFFTQVTMYENQGGIFSSVTLFFQKVTQLIYGGFECYIVKTVVKTVIKLICYLIMYAHCPNLLTTGVLAALIAIDCLNTELDATTRKLVDALVEGKFSTLAKAILDVAKVDEEIPEMNADPMPLLQDQGPREFNDWSNVAKNCKWWFENLTSCFSWIKDKIFPPDISEAIDELEEHKDNIACVFAICDEHICNMMTDKNYSISSGAREKHRELVDMMSGILDFLQTLPKTTNLYSRAASLMHRLQQINFEPNLDWITRPEPVGIWISGEAGVGKSFLVKRIATQLAKHYGWRIYSNPTGSNHMDGYTDQQIHLFDDFGQNSEEEDYGLICQLISSCPFIVPKADVSAKGTPYNARVVLVTTNRHDFSSKKLFDPEALKRRFPIVLQIKPKEKYIEKGKINISLAMKTGDLISGNCWQRNLRIGTPLNGYPEWKDLDLDVLIKELIEEIDTRSRIVSLMNQGKDEPDGFFGKFKKFSDKVEKVVERRIRKNLFVSLQEPESFFDCEKIARTTKACAINLPNKTKWEQCKFLVSEAIAKLKKYLDKHRIWIMAIGAIGSVISVASLVIPWGRRQNPDGHYDGRAPVRLTRDFQRVAQAHLAKFENQGNMDFSIVTRRLVEVEDLEGFKATGVTLGNKEVLTYGHDCFNMVDGSDIVRSVSVTINDQPMDLQICTVKTKTQYKQLSNLIHEEDYKGHGFLIWKKGSNFYVQPVRNIEPTHGFSTWSGTRTTYGYVYEAPTTKGSCGGVLVAPVNGNLKILGIHVAGNGVDGVAARIFKFFTEQGKITSMQIYEKPLYHQPRISAYKKSPFYHDSSVEPAVLSKNDPRLEEDIEDMAVKAAMKYTGNTFNPPPACFSAAVSKVASMLRKVVRKSESISYSAATSGELLPIDWSTSPGIKYSGRSKRDLVDDPKFQDDVFKQLENPSTKFVTYLKDELRPTQKVRSGKTRAIEACSFDFVVAFRMVCGSIYHQIYDDVACISGIAVGICPYLHWGTFMRRHKQYALCLDFSSFDGSLPPELMHQAVEVCAQLHEDPHLVRKIHGPVISSTHLVTNQEWTVEGGMCSGSPCTSVLNSICNNIAAITVAISCGADLDDIHVTSYGDDIIISASEPFSTKDIQMFYKEFFGMKVTASDKTDDIKWVPIDQAEFLKRTTGNVDFFPFPVGKLNLKSMLDNIQWTKGSFEQQLESFCLELVLHGEEVYTKVISLLHKVNSRVQIPSYYEMSHRMKSIMYNQGKPEGFEGQENELLAIELAEIQPTDTYYPPEAIALYKSRVIAKDSGNLYPGFFPISEQVRDTETALKTAVWEAEYWMKECKGDPLPSTKGHLPVPTDEEAESLLSMAYFAKAHLPLDEEKTWELSMAIIDHIYNFSQADLFHDDVFADVIDLAYSLKQVEQERN